MEPDAHTASPSGSHEPIDRLRKELIDGLLFCHERANANTAKVLEVASFAYALIELLAEKGVLSIAELDERKRQVGERLAHKLKAEGMGVMLQDGDADKYQFPGVADIDCRERLPICHAACCRLDFALSRQDVLEGVLKWDLGRPYMIAKNESGHCEHLDRCRSTCTVYAQRPIPCRAYDCRSDTRIWQDYEQAIISPNLEQILRGSPSGSPREEGQHA